MNLNVPHVQFGRTELIHETSFVAECAINGQPFWAVHENPTLQQDGVMMYEMKFARRTDNDIEGFIQTLKESDSIEFVEIFKAQP